mmetsp:Transcript_32495/g.60602  ORF Transcript_32495/g.60602 Transcript_32495/m.60602 type:complete len:112 (-) Transcript_32495:296-631(-)
MVSTVEFGSPPVLVPATEGIKDAAEVEPGLGGEPCPGNGTEAEPKSDRVESSVAVLDAPDAVRGRAGGGEEDRTCVRECGFSRLAINSAAPLAVTAVGLRSSRVATGGVRA